MKQIPIILWGPKIRWVHLWAQTLAWLYFLLKTVECLYGNEARGVLHLFQCIVA